MQNLFLLLAAASLLGCGNPPTNADAGARTDASARDDAGADGSALPVRCPAGASDPVCLPPSHENAAGRGPRVREQLGPTPMLTGGVIDATRTRLLIGGAWSAGDSAQGAVLAIDLATGDRTVVSGAMNDPRTGVANTGAGPELGHVRDVAERTDGDLVALSELGERFELLRIDPTTGDRTSLFYNQWSDGAQDASTFCTDGAGRTIPNYGADDLAIGPSDEIYLVAKPAHPNAGAIVALSADGSTCTIVSLAGTDQPEGAARGSGPSFLPGVKGLRFAAGRLYTTQFTGGQLLAIDVASGDRVVVSSHSSSAPVGDGGELGFSRLVVDAEADRVVTIDDSSGGFTLLTEVALSSGDRTVISLVSNTANAPGDGGVWIHPSRPLLVSVAWRVGITLIDPATGEANLLSN